METTEIYTSDTLTITRLRLNNTLPTTFSEEQTQDPIYKVEKENQFQFSISTTDIKEILSSSSDSTTSTTVFGKSETTYCPICDRFINSDVETVQVGDAQFTLHTNCEKILHTIIEIIANNDTSTIYTHYI